MKQKAAGFFRILMGILRELSDQNAYERHLRSHGRVHSPEEWRHFQVERARLKYQNPRCC